MATFQDRTGREWVVEIHPTNMKWVRESTSTHLGTLLNNNMAGLATLLADPIELVNVLYVLCRDQAASLKLSEEDFGRQLDGDAYDAAADAFTAALANFSPARLRKPLLALLKKEREYRTAAGLKAEADVEAIDVNEVLRAVTSNNSAGSSAALSGSIPDG